MSQYCDKFNLSLKMIFFATLSWQQDNSSNQTSKGILKEKGKKKGAKTGLNNGIYWHSMWCNLSTVGHEELLIKQ